MELNFVMSVGRNGRPVAVNCGMRTGLKIGHIKFLVVTDQTYVSNRAEPKCVRQCRISGSAMNVTIQAAGSARTGLISARSVDFIFLISFWNVNSVVCGLASDANAIACDASRSALLRTAL